MIPDEATRHATAVVIGETGVLIEGASGSGKSSLAAALLVDAALFGWFGRLVGDDRLHLTARGGRLIARPHPVLAGLIERRGTGLVAVPHEPACVLGLALYLARAEEDRGARHPDRPPTRRLLDVDLPALELRAGDGTAENSRRVFTVLTLGRSADGEPF